MLRLRATSKRRFDGESFVARVTRNQTRPAAIRDREILVCATPSDLDQPGFCAYLVSAGVTGAGAERVLDLPESLAHIDEGDVLRVSPRSGNINVLYRVRSASNTLLLTEECDNACIMCSQPPKKGSGRRTTELLDAIELIDRGTRELGISGGEPSLYIDDLVRLVRKLKAFLPTTALDVLSNARGFKHLGSAQLFGSVEHPDLIVGVPINADLADLHDFIVQRRGAFDETILGMMNLRRCGVKIEVRVVIQKQNVDRLVPLAYFIARNLAFCSHVALMGLEVHGFALSNYDSVWVDPGDYKDVLHEAVSYLDQMGLRVSIYNQPLCLLHPDMWQFARQSISDWKIQYLPVCSSCDVRGSCGGVFGTSHGHFSKGIAPVHTAATVPIKGCGR